MYYRCLASSLGIHRPLFSIFSTSLGAVLDLTLGLPLVQISFLMEIVKRCGEI